MQQYIEKKKVVACTYHVEAIKVFVRMAEHPTWVVWPPKATIGGDRTSYFGPHGSLTTSTCGESFHFSLFCGLSRFEPLI